MQEDTMRDAKGFVVRCRSPGKGPCWNEFDGNPALSVDGKQTITRKVSLLTPPHSVFPLCNLYRL